MLIITTMCCIFISAFSVPAVTHFSLNINLEQYDFQKKNSCKNQTGAEGKLPSHLPQIMLGGGSLFSQSKGFAVHREVGLKDQSEWVLSFESPHFHLQRCDKCSLCLSKHWQALPKSLYPSTCLYQWLQILRQYCLFLALVNGSSAPSERRSSDRLLNSSQAFFIPPFKNWFSPFER